MPMTGFLGKRPMAAARPIATAMTPPIPSFMILKTSTSSTLLGLPTWCPGRPVPPVERTLVPGECTGDHEHRTQVLLVENRFDADGPVVLEHVRMCPRDATLSRSLRDTGEIVVICAPDANLRGWPPALRRDKVARQDVSRRRQRGSAAQVREMDLDVLIIELDPGGVSRGIVIGSDTGTWRPPRGRAACPGPAGHRRGTRGPRGSGHDPPGSGARSLTASPSAEGG